MTPSTEPSLRANANDLEWEQLYDALVRDLGLDPESFQLLYPFTGWAWPETPPGYTSAARHDFCATMPQWSATGAYVSSGTRYDDAYGQFLSILLAHTSNPVLEQEIRLQQQVVQRAKNDYDTLYRQAALAYESATGGSNDPTFTSWLATPDGDPWARQLDGAWESYQIELAALTELIEQSETPGLGAALAAYQDRAYYARYQSPHLAAFPEVPAYEVGETPQQWLATIAAGGGTPATVRIPLAEGDATGGYRDTWAGSSLPVPYPFAEMIGPAGELDMAAFGWRPAGEEVEILLHLEAWDTVALEPAPWYHGELVCQRRSGPFVRGYSGCPRENDVALWGRTGAMNLRKTALLAAYRPRFEFLGEEGSPAFRGLRRLLQQATRLRIGPFAGVVAGEGALVAEPGRLSLEDTSELPMIFGVNVEMLPCGGEPCPPQTTTFPS